MRRITSSFGFATMFARLLKLATRIAMRHFIYIHQVKDERSTPSPPMGAKLFSRGCCKHFKLVVCLRYFVVTLRTIDLEIFSLGLDVAATKIQALFRARRARHLVRWVHPALLVGIQQNKSTLQCSSEFLVHHAVNITTCCIK